MDLASVERVHRCVEIIPLPDAPRAVRGVINVYGDILPVFDLRAQFGFPMREVRSDDHLIVAHALGRRIALLVDFIVDVIPCPREELIAAETILPGQKTIADALTVDGEIVLVHDLDALLAMEEHSLTHSCVL